MSNDDKRNIDDKKNHVDEKRNGSILPPASGNGHTATSGDKPKKNFLFVSWESLSGDLAWKVKQEGHNVKAYIDNKKEKDVYDGFFDKVDDWKGEVEWSDIIVFDDTGFGREADSLRKKGKLVVGGSVYTDRLEEDREFGQAEMKRVGMLTLPHWDFENFDEAIKFLKENPGRYIFKPSQGTYGDMRGIVFLGEEEDGKDIVQVLEHNKSSWQKKIRRFQIQKQATGVEVAVGAFFNGEDFLTPININFEHKKLFPGDLGPYTGEMGCLMYWSPPNTLFNNTLAKMKDDLKSAGYVGYIDINCIANARGIYPLEFTSRFGYPTISIQMEGIMQDVGDWLFAMASHQSGEFRVRKGFQVGAIVAVPPFPYTDEDEFSIYKDFSILFKKPNLDGIHLGDVKLMENDWRVAGQLGYALVVTGSGLTVEEARKQCYGRISNIMLQNMFYRTDIGEHWAEDSDRLHMWGYLY